MSTLMGGGQADATEDMFSKLESMRAVITEVNTQFKDPVRTRSWTLFFPFPYPRT
jgi:arsenite/tail-anchored protein-transporting ATPase